MATAKAKTPKIGPNGKHLKGFAVMSPEQRSAIASQGGIAAHKMGRAHEWTSDEAREAGRKGGKTTGAKTLSR